MYNIQKYGIMGRQKNSNDKCCIYIHNIREHNIMKVSFKF